MVRLIGYGRGRRNPRHRVIKKAEDFGIRVLRQRFDQLAAPKNFQERLRRCARRDE
jgi:hypothetical protein